MASTKLLKALTLAMIGGLGCQVAVAQQQQATFAVAVALHQTISRPLLAEKLCATGNTTSEIVGAAIRVNCLDGDMGSGAGMAASDKPQAPRGRAPEVTVSF